PSVDSTLNTGYGREVLIKVALLAVLMVPAAYNLRRVGPGLARLRDMLGPAFQALAQGFHRSIRVEALLVSTVLVFSALLTLSATPMVRSPLARPRLPRAPTAHPTSNSLSPNWRTTPATRSTPRTPAMERSPYLKGLTSPSTAPGRWSSPSAAITSRRT